LPLEALELRFLSDLLDTPHNGMISELVCYIEPMKLVIEAEREEAEFRLEEFAKEEYFLNKILRSATKIRQLRMSRELLGEMVGAWEEKHEKDILELKKIISDHISLFTEAHEALRARLVLGLNRLRREFGHDLYVYLEKAVIRTISVNSLIVIGKDSGETKEVVDWIKAEIERLQSVTSDFGLSVRDVLIGHEYALDVLRRNASNPEIIEKTPKNDFEKDVGSKVRQITDGVLSNLELRFKKPSETLEYDLLIPLSDSSIVNIEVKDYETVKEETDRNSESLKSRVILNPIDKARRLGGSIVKVVVIARGFTEHTFSQLKEFAESREVALLDGANYQTEIEKTIVQNALGRYRGSRLLIAPKRYFNMTH